jgi:hypothetical protein
VHDAAAIATTAYKGTAPAAEFEVGHKKELLPMPGMETKDVKSAARQLVDSLPDDATWDDVMYRVYVRQAIDAGRQDAADGRLIDVAEVRRQFGLPE